jgi:hypothetical protein
MKTAREMESRSNKKPRLSESWLLLIITITGSEFKVTTMAVIVPVVMRE